MIVVDASVILDLLLRTSTADAIEKQILIPGESLHAPHLVDLEVAQVLRRYLRSGQITAQRGREATADLLDLPIRRYPHDLFLERIWELRNNMTAYDAVYVALAEALPALLLTRDGRLAASQKHKAVIKLV